MSESWHHLCVCGSAGCVFVTACVSPCRPSGQRKGGRCTARLRMQMGVASAQWWLLNRICAPEMPKAGSSASSWRRYTPHRHTLPCMCDNTSTCSLSTPCVYYNETAHLNPEAYGINFSHYSCFFAALILWEIAPAGSITLFSHFCIYNMDDISWMATWEDENTIHPTLIDLENRPYCATNHLRILLRFRIVAGCKSSSGNVICVRNEINISFLFYITSLTTDAFQ